MMSLNTTAMDGDISALDDSAAATGEAQPRAKKLKTDESQMDVDGDEDGDPSDADSVPDEHIEDED